MPFSVQVLCKETSFQSSSFKRHHIHPSCPLLPHDSCKSTYFSKTTLEPKQVDFIRRNYTKAFYCHVDLEQWWVMVWRIHFFHCSEIWYRLLCQSERWSANLVLKDSGKWFGIVATAIRHELDQLLPKNTKNKIWNLSPFFGISCFSKEESSMFWHHSSILIPWCSLVTLTFQYIFNIY